MTNLANAFRDDPIVNMRGTGVWRLRVRGLLKGLDAIEPLQFRHYRDAMGGAFGSHRREWKSKRKVEFAERQGLREERLNSRPSTPGGFFGTRTFFYKIFPKEKRWTGGRGPSVDDIKAETYTNSVAALGLEVGGVFRAKRNQFVAIPIGITLDSLGRPKSRWATPSLYRRAGQGNRELVSFSFGRGALPKLYQVRGGGSRKAAEVSGAISRVTDAPTGRRRSGRQILLPAYQLVREVDRRPLLRYLATWEALRDDRTRRFRRALDRVLEDQKNGLTS